MAVFIPNLPRYGGRCVNCALWRIGINVPWTHVEKMKRKFGENMPRVPTEDLKVYWGCDIAVIAIRVEVSDVRLDVDVVVKMSPTKKVKKVPEKFVDNCRPKFGECDEGRGARDDQGAEANVG